MPKIIIKKSGTVEAELELQSESIAVGRETGNDIILNDPSVSRRHARIESTDGGYRIVDLDSGNGLHHQGESVPSVDLYPGCEIEVGAYTLAYQSDEPPPPKLVLIGGAKQEVFHLMREETFLGRSADASVTIDDPLVSSFSSENPSTGQPLGARRFRKSKR